MVEHRGGSRAARVARYLPYLRKCAVAPHSHAASPHTRMPLTSETVNGRWGGGLAAPCGSSRHGGLPRICL